jgi:hypothetical protein
VPMISHCERAQVIRFPKSPMLIVMMLGLTLCLGVLGHSAGQIGRNPFHPLLPKSNTQCSKRWLLK